MVEVERAGEAPREMLQDIENASKVIDVGMRDDDGFEFGITPCHRAQLNALRW